MLLKISCHTLGGGERWINLKQSNLVILLVWEEGKTGVLESLKGKKETINNRLGLPTYSSLDPMFSSIGELSVNIGLGEGWVGRIYTVAFIEIRILNPNYFSW